MPRKEILHGLEEIRGIIEAFSLKWEKTASAVHALRSFSGEENQVCCYFLKFQEDARSSQSRILRLKVSQFVGRKRALNFDQTSNLFEIQHPKQNRGCPWD